MADDASVIVQKDDISRIRTATETVIEKALEELALEEVEDLHRAMSVCLAQLEKCIDKIASLIGAPAKPTRRIVDVGIAELSDLANDAWNSAARDALTQGLAVTGSRDGRRIRQYPDGHQDDLGPVTPLPDNAKPSRR